MSSFLLEVEKREQRGSSNNRRLRRQGRVPAVIYGGGQTPLAVSIDHARLLREMEQQAFYTSVLTLQVGAESQPAVVKEVQRHPFKPYLLHLDFQRVVEDQEINLYVPIHFVGEEVSRGVKEQGGVVEHLMTEVEVTCLPRHLPEYLELDVTSLELNGILHLSDIPLPEGVTLVPLTHQQDHPVISISPPRREEEEVEAVAEPEAEVPTVAETETPEESDAD